MSTKLTGDAEIGREIVASVQDQLDAARDGAEAEQLDLLDPVTPEDIWDARETLGPDAHHSDVTQLARSKKRGRPKGARNRRTDDFERYILGFGRHPAITLMEILSTAPEVLMEASRRRKVHSFQKDGTANVVMEHMTYAEAQSLRIRCADIMLPYIEGKKPLKVDMSFSGVGDLIIEGVTHSADEIGDIMDAEYLDVADEDRG